MSARRPQSLEARGLGFAPLAPVSKKAAGAVDVYFSADVETDGPIPGEFSMLSFAMVYAGRFDGQAFERPRDYTTTFEANLRPISSRFQREALEVNGLDRERLQREGQEPAAAMAAAAEWLRQHTHGGTPVLVAYPLSFDWTSLYWYFVRYRDEGTVTMRAQAHATRPAPEDEGQEIERCQAARRARCDGGGA
jgi:hypothetical protein